MTLRKSLLLLALTYLRVTALISPRLGRSTFRQPFNSLLVLEAQNGAGGGSTSEKPLYDGTNYTFPDTTTPDGIAEVLEVSFVNACMQLRTGFVDVLKMFIATSMASYELGFSLNDVQEALKNCPRQTANRELMPEEGALRSTWLSLVYLTLQTMGHPTRLGSGDMEIPEDVAKDYGNAATLVAAAFADEVSDDLSVDMLVKLDAEGGSNSIQDPMTSAIRSQSLRVVGLTPTVVRESMEATMNEPVAPPTPPIKGAFE